MLREADKNIAFRMTKRLLIEAGGQTAGDTVLQKTLATLYMARRENGQLVERITNRQNGTERVDLD